MQLEVQNIIKQFGRSRALDDVSLTVPSGNVLALLGENGAGKSTLIKILSGIYKTDSGQILLDGVVTQFDTPAQAMAAGVVLVPQELRIVPELSVAENISLGQLPVKRFAGILPQIDWKAMRTKAEKALQLLGVELNLNAKASTLDFASRQLLVIARALSHSARLLILDEPTASLEGQEVTQLFAVIRRLKNQGVTVIYISHRLEEVEQIADRCVILRDGKVAASIEQPPFPDDVLVKAMTGRQLQNVSSGERATGAAKSQIAIGDETVVCHTNQVIGLSGLLGSGTAAVLHKKFGTYDKSRRAMSAGATRQSIKQGIGLVPAERASTLIFPMSIRDNIILPHLSAFTSRFGRNEKRIDAVVNALMDTFDIRPRDPYMPVGKLSGGNQQKVAFAKWLSGHLELLLLDEPTNGIDIAAKALIHEYINNFAAEGGSVYLSSTDLPELLNLSDEIIVMRQGHYAGHLMREQHDKSFSEQKLRNLLGIG